MAYKVWFIRHGQSVSNVDLPTTHPAESELTPQGEQEALLVPNAFMEKPDLIVVSPFFRARQTAVPTLTHFAPIGQETWPVHEFTYLAAWHYAGTTGSDRRPLAHAYWQRNDPDYKEDGEAESFSELLARTGQIMQRLQAHPARFIALFSHGLFIRALLWSLISRHQEATSATMQMFNYFLRAVKIPNGAICPLQLGHNDIHLGLIQTDHLMQLPKSSGDLE